jgi:hypothetical protein
MLGHGTAGARAWKQRVRPAEREHRGEEEHDPGRHHDEADDGEDPGGRVRPVHAGPGRGGDQDEEHRLRNDPAFAAAAEVR